MFKETAAMLHSGIESIAREWVDELRISERTEVQKQMLTSEIVSGVKGLLTNLAFAVELGESPDEEKVDPPVTQKMQGPSGERRPVTRPLTAPLAIARQGAAHHGTFRHDQHYALHDVIFEFVKLREVIWNYLTPEFERAKFRPTLALSRYLDRLIDELMLAAAESFYRASIRDLETRAIRDPLTNLYNKEYLVERLNEEVRRGVRYSDVFSLVMIDMDALKPLNDSLGHQAGDAVIVALAGVIARTCRQPDIPCRYGGDEFAVILPETGKERARTFAERLIAVVHDEVVRIPGHPATGGASGGLAHDALDTGTFLKLPSVSIGISTFPEDGRDPELLVSRADAALYRAKHEGRDRVSF